MTRHNRLRNLLLVPAQDLARLHIFSNRICVVHGRNRGAVGLFASLEFFRPPELGGRSVPWLLLLRVLEFSVFRHALTDVVFSPFVFLFYFLLRHANVQFP